MSIAWFESRQSESTFTRIFRVEKSRKKEQEIAGDVGIPRTSVETVLTKTAELPNPSKLSFSELKKLVKFLSEFSELKKATKNQKRIF